MEKWFLVMGSFATFITILLTSWVKKWRNPSCNGELPPGSMGIPLLGESIQFFRSHSSLDVHPFFKDRMKRYGNLFKTSLLGYPVVVITDPEFSHFIFQQEWISVDLWYMDAFAKLFGKKIELASSTSVIHKYLRNMVIDIVGPEKQKEKIILEMEDIARTNLDILCRQDFVEVKEAAITMAFNLSSKKLLSYDATKHSDNLKDCFRHFLQGIISFPINIPGTIYYKCLKDQRKGIKMLKDLLKERIESDKKHGDMIDLVVEDMNKEEAIFDLNGAAYFLFIILFASFETVALGTTSAINFIAEHPLVLKELMEEHEGILEKKNDGDSLTWNEYKSMKFTSYVINETLRLANIAPTILRRVTRDIEIDGYTIPAGWITMVCAQTIHLNPEKYEDPLVFNPWRWKDNGSSTSTKSFVAFGGGMRLCAGAEFAKLQMAIILHFLVTKYRWTKIGGGEIIKNQSFSFPNSLQIKITKKM